MKDNMVSSLRSNLLNWLTSKHRVKHDAIKFKMLHDRLTRKLMDKHAPKGAGLVKSCFLTFLYVSSLLAPGMVVLGVGWCGAGMVLVWSNVTSLILCRFPSLLVEFNHEKKMDTDWTFISCSWLWEEDNEFKNECIGSEWTKEEEKAFGDALALFNSNPDRWDKITSSVPGKTIEELKLQYEDICEDVLAIESGKTPLPQSNDSDHEKKKKTLRGVNRGLPWTEDEHRRFLDGLAKYGRGDWKSIARYSVQTKSNSQVASHAQKYFKRMNSTSKDGKRHSINDVTFDHPETTPAPQEPMTSTTMPGDNDDSSENVRKQLLMGDTPFKSTSIPPISSHTIEEPLAFDGSVFDSLFASQSIQELDSGSTGTATYYPSLLLTQDCGGPHPLASFDFPPVSEIEHLTEDCGVPTPYTSSVPVIPEIQSLTEDNDILNIDSFDFSFSDEIHPVMQDNGINLGSYDVPSLSELQQPLLQESGAPNSESCGIPSVSTATEDIDIFALPHFLDID